MSRGPAKPRTRRARDTTLPYFPTTCLRGGGAVCAGCQRENVAVGHLVIQVVGVCASHEHNLPPRRRWKNGRPHTAKDWDYSDFVALAEVSGWNPPHWGIATYASRSVYVCGSITLVQFHEITCHEVGHHLAQEWKNDRSERSADYFGSLIARDPHILDIATNIWNRLALVPGMKESRAEHTQVYYGDGLPEHSWTASDVHWVRR